MTEHAWIDTPRALADFAVVVRAAPWVALDTEGDSMFRYRERVCLVQINAGGALAVIDPIALEADPAWPSSALDPLKAALEDPAQPLYLHGGENDVGVLARDYGIRCRGVFDSQQAAAFLGRPQTGYGALVLGELGVALDKSWTTYDWRTRPLHPEALAYALADVVHLPPLIERMRAAVAAAGLDDEVTLGCRAVEETSVHAPGYDPAGLWRLKGLLDLSPAQQAMAMALYAWRDGVAKERDIPPGRILNGDLLVALARTQPVAFGQLRSLGVHGRVLHEHGEAIIACVQQAKATPPEVPPRTRAREVEPVEELREEALKQWRRQESEQRAVPMQVVMPARALEHIKRFGAGDLSAVPQFGPKRIARYGEAVQAACARAEAAAADGQRPPRRRHRR
jgi:ribonuclease D